MICKRAWFAWLRCLDLLPLSRQSSAGVDDLTIDSTQSMSILWAIAKKMRRKMEKKTETTFLGKDNSGEKWGRKMFCSEEKKKNEEEKWDKFCGKRKKEGQFWSFFLGNLNIFIFLSSSKSTLFKMLISVHVLNNITLIQMESMLSSLICRFTNMHVDNKWGSCFRFLWHSRKVSSKTCSRVGNKRGIPKLPLISLINIAHMRSGGGVSNIKLCNNYQKISSVPYLIFVNIGSRPHYLGL